MIRFILHALAAAVGFWLASKIVPGVVVGGLGGLGSLLAVGLVLGIINALVRPILILLTFPLTLITLGLFLLVVNGVTVWLATAFPLGVHIDGLWHAILAAVIISLTSWLASALIGRSRPSRLSR
jgi:putative membrane protein